MTRSVPMTRTFAFGLAILLAMVRTGLTNAQSTPSTPSPQAKGDGLLTATPESVGLAAKPLHDMEAAIRAGEFKKIGRVLMARHGKLVFEAYFDGDSGTLRDTRSATK